MNPILRHSIARFALLTYVAAGILLEIGHHHPHDFACHAIPTLSSHNCGEKEIHIPLEKRRECLACTLSSLRLGTADAQPIYIPIVVVHLVDVPLLGVEADGVDVLHSGKRGPPRA